MAESPNPVAKVHAFCAWRSGDGEKLSTPWGHVISPDSDADADNVSRVIGRGYPVLNFRESGEGEHSAIYRAHL